MDYYHGHLGDVRFIAEIYYKNPNQYTSFTNILKHAAQHNTWNITHTLQHLQVQVVA